MSAEARIERVLVATTAHMPDLNEDISPWAWGQSDEYGLAWVYAYDEDTEIDGRAMPPWLLNLCQAARRTYGCTWILLDPDAGEEVPGLPLYEHP